ncbi:MAG: hypothetical protein OJF55_001651 [Rhodanobacteraceae bacterium]|jgi:hypothetical protein|nr:MAG: hypothetical protein OJF55_001651 [Rhodanobacteraceae bacterium]
MFATRAMRVQANAGAASSVSTRRSVQFCSDVYTSIHGVRPRIHSRRRSRRRRAPGVRKGFIRRKKLIDTAIAWG